MPRERYSIGMSNRLLTTLGLCVLFGLTAGTARAGTVTGVSVSPRSIVVGDTVSVTVTGTNPCGAAHIVYADGAAVTYAIEGLPTTQTHIYNAPGTYAIVARGMGNRDGEATTTLTVSARPNPPPAEPAAQITGVALAPRPGLTREPVTITGNGTGTCAYEVHYGDGNAQEVNGKLPQQFRHTYVKADTYTVIVKPSAPCTGKFTQVLQVVDARPQAGRISRVLVSPSPADAGQPVAISVEGSGSCGNTIDFGDGNSEPRSTTLPDRLRHVYPAAGSYTVVAMSEAPCSGSARSRLEVRDAQRAGITRVDVSPTPATQYRPATIVLQGSGSCRTSIDFGDGNTQSWSGNLPRRITHAYSAPGKYTIAAWVAAPCVGNFEVDLEVVQR